MKIFSIKDKKSGAFDNPFYRASYAEAERSFQMLAKDEKTMIHHYPEDYSLFEIGEFDSTTGEILPCDPKKVLDLPPKSAMQQ